jgi:glycosyltransferase involved in cell wall biosynthesis
MRFCMVTTFYPPLHAGGDAIYVQALARALSREGHDVDVIHCEDAARLAGARRPDTSLHEDRDGDICVHRLRHPFGFLSPLFTHQTGRPGPKLKALRALLERGYDVIHFHNISLVGGPGVLGLGRARVRLYTLHEHWLICPTHVLWKNRERACERPTCFSCSIRSGIAPQWWRRSRFIEHELRHVDLVLAPSAFSADRHRAAGIVRPIEVLPHFSRLDPGLAFVPGPPARPRFLFVGRVTVTKGVGVLAALFAGLPQYDLWIAGDGDLLPALEARYKNAPNIRFLGRVDAPSLTQLYGSATATIVASLAPEAHTLVALESFAHKTPVLALDVGGCGEAVRASGGGIVCRDVDDLATAIHTIARNPDVGRELGWRGRKAFEEKYTERTHVDAYLGQVVRLLTRAGPSAAVMPA